jgi:hypothetical protein
VAAVAARHRQHHHRRSCNRLALILDCRTAWLHKVRLLYGHHTNWKCPWT